LKLHDELLKSVTESLIFKNGVTENLFMLAGRDTGTGKESKQNIAVAGCAQVIQIFNSQMFLTINKQ